MESVLLFRDIETPPTSLRSREEVESSFVFLLRQVASEILQKWLGAFAACSEEKTFKVNGDVVGLTGSRANTTLSVLFPILNSLETFKVHSQL